MVKKLTKAETIKQIDEFFKEIKNKTPKEVKKIKRLAMKQNIPLRENRKLFCKKCLMPHVDSSIRIKNNKITIICGNCGYKNNWKID